MYTNKSKPFVKKYLLPLLEGEKNQAHTVKHSTLTMQPVHYHYKKQSVKHMEKNTLLSLNM